MDEGLGEDGGSEFLTAQEATADIAAGDMPPEGMLPEPLTEEQVEEIATLLRAGRRLPPYLVPHLFEAPREYQLAYRGKARPVDVLSETMAVPLQAVRTYGAPGSDGWSNMLVFGDNLQVLRHLLNLKEDGQLNLIPPTS